MNEEIQRALDNLNNVVGTPEVDMAVRKLAKLLPPGFHMDFGLGTKKFCIVNYWGARVM